MIKLFENFDKVYLEVCVPDEHKKRFEKLYATKAKENPKRKDGYNDRHRSCKYNAWGIEFRVYFKTSKSWIIESLRKLGYHTEISKKLVAVEFNGQYPNHGYTNRVTNQDLFWWLVEYGYRLGENDCIPYDFYVMRKTLEAMKDRKEYIIPTITILQIESENPVEEAKMLMEV